MVVDREVPEGQIIEATLKAAHEIRAEILRIRYKPLPTDDVSSFKN
jgi:hypothetical protein